jgi:hypothetical protein
MLEVALMYCGFPDLFGGRRFKLLVKDTPLDAAATQEALRRHPRVAEVDAVVIDTGLKNCHIAFRLKGRATCSARHMRTMARELACLLGSAAEVQTIEFVDLTERTRMRREHCRVWYLAFNHNSDSWLVQLNRLCRLKATQPA